MTLIEFPNPDGPTCPACGSRDLIANLGEIGADGVQPVDYLCGHCGHAFSGHWQYSVVRKTRTLSVQAFIEICAQCGRRCTRDGRKQCKHLDASTVFVSNPIIAAREGRPSEVKPTPSEERVIEQERKK